MLKLEAWVAKLENLQHQDWPCCICTARPCCSTNLACMRNINCLQVLQWQGRQPSRVRVRAAAACCHCVAKLVHKALQMMEVRVPQSISKPSHHLLNDVDHELWAGHIQAVRQAFKPRYRCLLAAAWQHSLSSRTVCSTCSQERGCAE